MSAEITQKLEHSDGEIEFRTWLNSLGYEFESNYGVLQHGLELDCYDPKCKFAFEYCGLYWHSNRFKGHFYHKNKMSLAKDSGLTLITVFEDEWLNRKKQVQDFIKAKLGIFDRRVYARSCKLIDNLDIKVGKRFLEDNHIQGASSIAYRYFALSLNEEIVGVMSFSVHHRNSKDKTLSRIAFKAGVLVVGGMSRLITAAKEQIGSFVTWSDNRWSDGQVYAKCGLLNDRDVSVDYSYVVNKGRVPKQKMTKSKLGCPADTTEREFCEARGWYRIFDCGKKRWAFSVV